MNLEKERDILEQLKTVRKLKGYSYQYIADKTEEMGQAVSLSSVKRVFSADSDLESFRYNTTIRPIAAVVLDFEEETTPPQGIDDHIAVEYYTTIEAYKSIIDIKNKTIESMQRTIDEKTRDRETTRAEYQKGINDRNRTIRNMSIVIFILLAIILGAIALDLAFGGIGWIRRSIGSFSSSFVGPL